MGLGGLSMNKNKSIYFTIIVTCLMTVGCSSKEQTRVETDNRYVFVCKITNNLIANPQSNDYQYFSTATFGESESHYSCEVLCNYNGQTSVYDVGKPFSSSFTSVFYKDDTSKNVSYSRSGSSNGEELIYKRKVHDQQIENSCLYYRMPERFRFDFDFDYDSFTKIYEYISSCKDNGKLVDETLTDETKEYSIGIYPESHLLSCFAIKKDNPFETYRTNFYYDSPNSDDELYITVITSEIIKNGYLQYVSFVRSEDTPLPLEQFPIEPEDANVITDDEALHLFEGDINAYVSIDEMIKIHQHL